MAEFPLPAPMRRALNLAAEAAADSEVPVGAVVTRDGVIIGEGRNTPRASLDPTAHAEILAIRAAATTIRQPRLDGCTLWVTLEPCAMCAGAIAIARLATLVFGAEDPKGGAVLHGPRLFAQTTCHHRPEIMSGVGDDEAARQLRDFFAIRRSNLAEQP